MDHTRRNIRANSQLSIHARHFRPITYSILHCTFVPEYPVYIPNSNPITLTLTLTLTLLTLRLILNLTLLTLLTLS